MNKELLTQAGIDVNDGIRRFNDKEDLYEQISYRRRLPGASSSRGRQILEKPDSKKH